MRAIMVMFDSLNRHFLAPYGCDWTHTPNFSRLAKRTATFETSYVCSMPCMPARRDLHTGRPSFMHRSWGPLEPYDDSMPEMLKTAGVYTHLCTDHQHYWEDGGATYHQRFSTFDFIRGQEGDKWHPLKRGIAPSPDLVGRNAAGKGTDDLEWQDRVNRHFMPAETDHPQTRTFASGLRFIDLNKDEQNWFLQIETFDPHEPFFTHDQYKMLYEAHYLQWRRENGKTWDWPGYEPVDAERHPPELIEHIRHEYASLLSMCDAKLGLVLDAFDKHDLWKDTMLIVCTDHGFLLGEHDWWAKMRTPWWSELANTPFFVWDPRSPSCAGTRRNALVQPAIDIAPTVLRYFGLEPTADMTGRDLAPAIEADRPVRDAAIFGVHGSHANVTDGRYVYMRAQASEVNEPLFEYTLMPTHMKARFAPAELQPELVSIAPPFPFTKGCAVMRIKSRGAWGAPGRVFGTLLYDLVTDPGQTKPLKDPAIEQRMISHLVREMHACHAPAEQFERLGLS